MTTRWLSITMAGALLLAGSAHAQRYVSRSVVRFHTGHHRAHRLMMPGGFPGAGFAPTPFSADQNAAFGVTDVVRILRLLGELRDLRRGDPSTPPSVPDADLADLRAKIDRVSTKLDGLMAGEGNPDRLREARKLLEAHDTVLKRHDEQIAELQVAPAEAPRNDERVLQALVEMKRDMNSKLDSMDARLKRIDDLDRRLRDLERRMGPADAPIPVSPAPSITVPTPAPVPAPVSNPPPPPAPVSPVNTPPPSPSPTAPSTPPAGSLPPNPVPSGAGS
jgi:hypothetical protein